MRQHVQVEVERIIGHGSALSMNTTAGFLELGPDHRAPLRTRYEDMVEFDEQVDRFEDVHDESHQEDPQEVK
ncbi:hypothetical protein C5167_041987 [Papaver somniferum]|nr:hypothetical protein C5167_041987 [Papaver somniferum]